MDSFESLLKAAQDIDSPNFNVKVVVELKQAEASTPMSTPPRPRAAATMPPPPSPPRVPLAEHYSPAIGNSGSGVLSVPSLYSPCRAPAPTLHYYNNYYVAPAPATEQSSPGSLYAPPASALAAMMMMSSPASAPSTSWPYYKLSPRFSGGYHPEPVVGNISSAVGAQPFCLFPAAAAFPPKDRHGSPQASQGLADHTAAAAAVAAAPTAPTGRFFRPIAEHTRSATKTSTFVSPDPKKSRIGIGHRVPAAATRTAGFLELKPSAEDDAPPEEEDTADAKMRILVTPDAEVFNDEDNAISTYDERAYPVDESTTLPTLFDEKDIPFVNPAHYIICSEILEPFVVPKYDDDAFAAVAATSVYKKSGKKARSRKALPTRSTRTIKGKRKKSDFRAGSVAFRCRFCKHSRRKGQYPLATLYPQKIDGLYRANLRFQTEHLTVCRECPREIKKRLNKARQSYKVKEGGVKNHWIATAVRKGFRDCNGKIGFLAHD